MWNVLLHVTFPSKTLMVLIYVFNGYNSFIVFFISIAHLVHLSSSFLKTDFDIILSDIDKVFSVNYIAIVYVVADFNIHQWERLTYSHGRFFNFTNIIDLMSLQPFSDRLLIVAKSH